jgi:hypothetical protein
MQMSPRAIIKSLLALTLALAAAALAYGCGSGGAAAVLDPVAKAAQTTGNAEGAKLEMHVRVNLGSLGGQIALDGSGHEDFKNREGELQMQFSGLPAAASAVLGANTTMTEIFKGSTVYVGSPVLAGKLPNGAQWMKLDVAKAAQSLGIDPQSLGSGETNPAQFLDYLHSLGGSVKESGTETIRGVPTTRYTSTIDFQKLVGQLPSSDQSAAKSTLDQMISKLGLSSIPVQVWVDAQHLVRKVAIDIPINTAGQNLDSSVAIEFFDFGPTPAVHAPADSETYEVNPGSLGAGAGV